MICRYDDSGNTKTIDDLADQIIELIDGLTNCRKCLLLSRLLVTDGINDIVIDIDHPSIANRLIGLSAGPTLQRLG